MLQRIRNILQVTWGNCHKVTGTCSSYLKKMSQRIKNVLQFTWQTCYNVSTPSCVLPVTYVTTYQEDPQKIRAKNILRIKNAYLKKTFQHIRTFCKYFETRCYKVSRTSCKLLDEHVTTYQERFARYLKNMLQRIRRIVKGYVTKIFLRIKKAYLKNLLQRSRNVLQVVWIRCYNISKMSSKILAENVTRYQERFASYLTTMLQHIKNLASCLIDFFQ